MIVEIWILEKDVERLKKLCTSWFSDRDVPGQQIRYYTSQPQLPSEWICVHLSLDNYTVLKDNNLLIK